MFCVVVFRTILHQAAVAVVPRSHQDAVFAHGYVQRRSCERPARPQLNVSTTHKRQEETPTNGDALPLHVVMLVVFLIPNLSLVFHPTQRSLNEYIPSTDSTAAQLQTRYRVGQPFGLATSASWSLQLIQQMRSHRL